MGRLLLLAHRVVVIDLPDSTWSGVDAKLVSQLTLRDARRNASFDKRHPTPSTVTDPAREKVLVVLQLTASLIASLCGSITHRAVDAAVHAGRRQGLIVLTDGRFEAVKAAALVRVYARR